MYPCPCLKKTSRQNDKDLMCKRLTCNYLGSLSKKERKQKDVDKTRGRVDSVKLITIIISKGGGNEGSDHHHYL